MRVRELKRELLEKIDSLDARIIMRIATGLDDIHQITEADTDLSDSETAMARKLMERRLAGTPMAYITGEKEFYGLPFHVTEDVLIPRPDTETLVDVVLGYARRYADPRILDLCTGSGAIATAIACSLGSPVAMSDISGKALAIAACNYERNTGTRTDARLGSLFEPWAGERFDIIATNPPYLTQSWYEETDKDVKAEPSLALLGGDDDGLGIIRSIISLSPEYLNEGGVLAIECDYRQAESCARILRNEGFSEIAVAKDAAGKERVVHGTRLS